MNQEIFDVVNDQDEIIGFESRANVHQLGLKHRAVHILVFNRQGEVFVQKRSRKKDCFAGLWDSSAAGHLDRGEPYDACAVRELREELGLRLDHPPDRLFKIAACPETGQEFCWVYQCRAEEPLKLSSEEIDEGRWVAPDQLSAWIKRAPQDFAPALPLIWRRWLAHGTGPQAP